MKKLTLLSLLAVCSVANAGEIANFHLKLYGANPRGSSSLPEVKRDTGITEIGLERTRCFGACPAYTVVVKSNGTLSYKGEAFVEKMGARTGKVEPWRFAQLARFIKDEGYMNLKNTYTVGITDQPTTYSTVVINNKRKVIRNYANSGPTKLWAIEQLIDKLMLEAKWDAEKPK